MKLSVSLTEEDLAVLDRYVARAGLRSRSAGVQHALRLLAHPDLEADYEAAWQEWSEGEAVLWDVTATDGTGRAAR